MADIPEVLVAAVDNGSRDQTRARLRGWAGRHPERIRPVLLDENAGYGGGILAGLRALPPSLAVAGWMWGDNQIDPGILPALYAACADDAADLAKARRVERQDGPARRAVTAVYAGTMRWGVGVRVADVNGCPKLFRREALDALALESVDWFLDAEAILKAEARGLRVAEQAAVMRPRLAGQSKVRWATVAEFAWNLVRRAPGYRDRSRG